MLHCRRKLAVGVLFEGHLRRRFDSPAITPSPTPGGIPTAFFPTADPSAHPAAHPASDPSSNQRFNLTTDAASDPTSGTTSNNHTAVLASDTTSKRTANPFANPAADRAADVSGSDDVAVAATDGAAASPADRVRPRARAVRVLWSRPSHSVDQRVQRCRTGARARRWHRRGELLRRPPARLLLGGSANPGAPAALFHPEWPRAGIALWCRAPIDMRQRHPGTGERRDHGRNVDPAADSATDNPNSDSVVIVNGRTD